MQPESGILHLETQSKSNKSLTIFSRNKVANQKYSLSSLFWRFFFVYLKEECKELPCFREQYISVNHYMNNTQNKALLFIGIWTGKDDKPIKKRHVCTKWKMKIWSFFVTCKKYTKIRVTANTVQQSLLYGVTWLHKITKESLCCLSFNYTRISWSKREGLPKLPS